MTTIHPGLGRLLAGFRRRSTHRVAVYALERERSRRQPRRVAVSDGHDGLLLISGLFGVAVAITGGRFGFFRRDLSLNGAADIVGVIAAILLTWLIAFDWPSGESRQAGAYVALAAAASIATGGATSGRHLCSPGSRIATSSAYPWVSSRRYSQPEEDRSAHHHHKPDRRHQPA